MREPESLQRLADEDLMTLVDKLDLDDDVVLETQPAAQRIEAEAIRRETADSLRLALGLLPREQSQVIELAYFGGFSHSEIAAMLGAPIGTVKGRMRLGLEKIRAALAEGFPEGRRRRDTYERSIRTGAGSR